MAHRTARNLGLVFLIASLAGCSSAPVVRKSYTPYSEQKPAATPVPMAPRAQASPTPIPTVIPPGTDVIKSAQTLYQNAKFDDAKNLLWSLSEEQIPPNSRAEYWNLRGLIELNKRQPEAAQLSFQRALTQNHVPEYRGYYQYNFASALYESNRPNDANDVLLAIDLTQLDSAQQAKVQNLKQKIKMKVPPALVASSASPLSTPVPGDPNARPGASPGPVEVYSGPTNPRRIGLLVPLSGKYENFGKRVQRAVELAFQHSSNSDAKSYEIVVADSGESPASHLEAMKKLVEEQQVIAIIGPTLSKGIEEIAARAAYYQVPLISIAQVQGPLASHLFSCSISNRDQAKKLAEFAMRERGFSRFAVLAPSNKPGEEMANAFWDEVESRKGTIKGFEYYDPDITDFREPVDKILGLHYLEPRAEELKALAEKRKEMKVTRKTMKTRQYFDLPPVIDFDAVFIADDGRTASQIIPTFAYRDAKNTVFLGTTSWNTNQFLQRAQDLSEGALIPVAFNTINPAKTSKAFYDLFLATYNTYPGEFDAIAFDAAAMVLKVLNRNPGSRESFRSDLEGAHGVDAATGEISMQDHRCSRHLTLYEVRKGKFEPLGD